MSDLAPLQAFSDALAALVAAAAPSMVAVHGHRSRSSGFIWRPGLVVTADEALAEEGDVSVELPGGETAAARIAGRDPTTDIALLRVDGPDRPAPLQSAVPATGAVVVVVGADDGAPTAALGIVARSGPAWRSLRGGEIEARLELDARPRRHAEGGLAFDASGKAFGMAVAGPRRRALVIPTATIERVAPALDRHGRIARGYLGLGLRPVAVEGGDATGLIVISVDPAGPGAAAGIHQGDVIVAWNGAPAPHLRSMLRSLGPDSIGRTISFDLRRAGEARQVSLTVGERPEG